MDAAASGRYGSRMASYQCHTANHPLDGVVTLPGSKSITNRALVCAALAEGTSLLSGILLAEDTRLMIDALRTLGIAVTVDEDGCLAEVTGCRGHIPACDAKLSCGNAGTVMRFCTALAALGQGRFELDGTERMRQRPIGQLVELLQTLGTPVEYMNAPGFPPITVHAKGLRGGHLSIHSPQSSQFVSAVLLAGPCASSDLFVELTGDLPSRPYLRLTTGVMAHFGVAVVEQFQAEATRFIVEAPQRYVGKGYLIEPDASNATYFLAAPAVAGGSVRVEGLGTDSLQGDVRFVDVLEQMGCLVERTPMSLTVSRPTEAEPLRAVVVDLNDMPDTFPTLAVLSLFAQAPTTIQNVANVRIKESDRIAAVSRELRKLGAVVAERPDGLTVTPPERLMPAAIDTYDDHRMAMSFALAGLKCPGLIINEAECCAKTFPDFFERFERMLR